MSDLIDLISPFINDYLPILIVLIGIIELKRMNRKHVRGYGYAEQES